MEAIIAGSALIGNLAVNLSMETAAFQRGAAQAEARAKTLQGRLGGIGKSMSGLGASLVAGAALGAVTTLATNAFQMASALDESAQKMGVTVEALQELRVAADQTGISEDTLSTAMARLNKSMGELQQGSKGMVAAFAAIGLSADELKGKTPQQALSLIADALNKLPTVQERVAAGAKIMGRGFSELLPLINLGSAGLDKYAVASQKAGQISTADAKKLDELADAWSRLKTRVGVATANMIAGIANFFTFYDDMFHKAGAAVKAFDAAVANMAKNAVAAVGNMVTGISQAITGRLSAIWEGAKAKIESVKAKFKDMYDAVVGNSYVPDMIEGIGQSMAELQRIFVDPAATATQKVGASFQSLANLIGGLFGGKTGSIIGALGGLVGSLAGIFGGSTALPNVAGMASGGSGVFGGRAGVDKNLLSLNGSPIARVSRGEHFSVGQGANENMARVEIVPSPYFDVRVQGTAVAVATPLAGRAAVMGAAGAEQRSVNAQRRRIP